MCVEFAIENTCFFLFRCIIISAFWECFTLSIFRYRNTRHYTFALSQRKNRLMFEKLIRKSSSWSHQLSTFFFSQFVARVVLRSFTSSIGIRMSNKFKLFSGLVFITITGWCKSSIVFFFCCCCLVWGFFSSSAFCTLQYDSFELKRIEY